MKYFLAFFIVLVIMMSFSTHALVKFTPSEAAISAKEKIDAAKLCLEEMKAKNIPIKRAEETYEEASHLYEAQLVLDEKHKRQSKEEDYALAVEYTEKVCLIRDSALEANDELLVFKKAFEESKSKGTNLSIMLSPTEDCDYNNIFLSFEEERFEETIELIDKGYDKIAEIEASQTTLNLFYSSTRKSIREFFKENWKKLSIISAIIILLLIIFWKTLKRVRIQKRIKHLEAQKRTLTNLIGQTQREYFETKKMSETEYSVKIEKFKEMIRDIDRQVPLLKEELMKVSKQKSISDKNAGLKSLKKSTEESQKEDLFTAKKETPKKRKNKKFKKE